MKYSKSTAVILNKLLKGTGILIASTALVYVLIQWLLPLVVGAGIEHFLKVTGYPESRIGSIEVGIHQTQIGDITLDSDQHLKTVRLHYSLSSILHGRMESVSIKGGQLKWPPKGDMELNLGDRLLNQRKQRSLPLTEDLPFEALELRNLTVSLVNYGGLEVAVQGNMHLDPPEKRVFHARLSTDSPKISLILGATGFFTSKGQFELTVDLAKGHFIQGAFRAQSIRGKISLRRFPPQGFRASAQLNAGIAKAQGVVSLSSTTLTYRGSPTGHRVIAQGTLSPAIDWSLRLKALQAGTQLKLKDSVLRINIRNLKYLDKITGGRLPLSKGSGSLEAQLAGTLPTELSHFQDSNSMFLEGELTVDLKEVSAKRLFSEAKLALVTKIQWQEGSLILQSEKPWQLTGQLDSKIIAPPLQSSFFSAYLRPSKELPLRIELIPSAQGITLINSGILSLENGPQKRLDLFMEGLSINTRPQGNKVYARHTHLNIDYSGELREGISIDHGTLRFTGEFTLTDDYLTIRPKGCTHLQIKGLTASRLTISEQNSCLKAPVDGPFIKITLSPPNRDQWSVTAHLRSMSANLSLNAWKAATDRMALKLPKGHFELRGKIGEGPQRLTAGLERGSLYLSSRAIRLDDITSQFLFSAKPHSFSSFTLKAQELMHEADPPLVNPLMLSLEAQTISKGDLSFTAKLEDTNETLLVNFTGFHNLDQATGSGTAILGPITFSPTLHKARQLFPALGRYLKELSGTLSLSTDLRWGPAIPEPGIAGSGKIVLEEMSGKLQGIPFKGLNSVVRLDSLYPPSTPQEQTLSLRFLKLGMGIALTNGIIKAGIPGTSQINLTKAEGSLLSGTVRIQPATFDLYKASHELTLTVENIDMRKLLSILAVEGLEGQGELEGKLPIHFSPSSITIKDGTLQAKEEGYLRYDPQKWPTGVETSKGSQMALLRQALRNFYYQELRLNLNGLIGGDQKIRLFLRGHNPDFYRGHPVKLNLNVEGALDTLVRHMARSYKIPEAIQSRILSKP